MSDPLPSLALGDVEMVQDKELFLVDEGNETQFWHSIGEGWLHTQKNFQDTRNEN